jgi:hypothetical protein
VRTRRGQTHAVGRRLVLPGSRQDPGVGQPNGGLVWVLGVRLVMDDEATSARVGPAPVAGRGAPVRQDAVARPSARAGAELGSTSDRRTRERDDLAEPFSPKTVSAGAPARTADSWSAAARWPRATPGRR